MKHLRQADGWFVTHDGCLKIMWRNRRTGEELTQHKRRRKNIQPEACTWHPTVPCADHPTAFGVKR